MKLWIAILLIATTAAGAGPVAAEPPPVDLANRIVSAGAPGAAVGIVRESHTSGFSEGLAVAGLRAAGSDVLVAPADQWHIGSLTKSMTATLVARLVEQRVISWDDTIGDALGTVAPDMDMAYRGLTFRHLLSHRAGLPANIDALSAFWLRGTDADRNPAGDRQRYVRNILSHPPEALPEREFLYSNAGYVVAGAMLEQITGMAWEELIAREVFVPLGLSSAGFGPPGTPGILDQPRGHRMSFGFRSVEPGRSADNIPALGPAGRVHISASDLLRYAQTHLTGAMDGNDYLTAESWHILHTPPFGGEYAMGWNVSPTGHLGHSGSNTYWLARIGIDPQAGRVFVLLANAYNPDVLRPLFDEIANDILHE